MDSSTIEEFLEIVKNRRMKMENSTHSYMMGRYFGRKFHTQ
jgi:hypothetical protein